jgi:hypothetical protein
VKDDRLATSVNHADAAPDWGVVGGRLRSTGRVVDAPQGLEKARRMPSQGRLAAMEAMRDLRVNRAIFKSTNNALAAREPPALSAFYADQTPQESCRGSLLHAEPADVERSGAARHEDGWAIERKQRQRLCIHKCKNRNALETG